jgi:hypothetical protein
MCAITGYFAIGVKQSIEHGATLAIEVYSLDRTGRM